MTFPRQTAGILLLLALLLWSLPLYAQEENTILVGGSGIALPLFEAFAEASDAAESVSATVTGTNAGIAGFCDGSFDVTIASRPITPEEEADCVTNQIEYFELLLAHDVLAFITHPDNSAVQCLTDLDLTAFFAPSAQGQPADWSAVNADAPGAVTLLVPPITTSTYALLDQIVEGDGIRRDITEVSNTEVVSQVSSTPGSLGVTSLAAASDAGDTVKILEISTTDLTGCNLPSAENVEGRSYEAATQFLMYVNTASLEKGGLNALLTFITTESNTNIVQELGFTPITSNGYVRNVGVLQNGQSGRAFSQEVTAFEIPPSLTGEIVIGGSANAFSYLQALTNLFTSQYPDAIVTYRVEGEPAGLRRLCNGELDIAITAGQVADDTLAGCEAQNISLYRLNLGAQAVVIIANAGADFLQPASDSPFCLSEEALTRIWAAHPGEPIVNWNQVDESYPDAALTLFAPREGDTYTSLMLAASSGFDVPIRPDLEGNADPLYRAAAAANVENALTFMSWRDYQRVLVNNQEGIQLVAIGADCVQPTPATILSGEYPLSRSAEMLVSTRALARTEVQSLLWFMLQDENYTRLENAGFIGVSFGDLPALRAELQQEFVLAQNAAQTTAGPEVTPDPGAEATPEATPEATAEATPETSS